MLLTFAMMWSGMEIGVNKRLFRTQPVLRE
jgi:hypothetical protein